MDMLDFRSDLEDEVSCILSSGFSVNLTHTQSVPHFDDSTITFPNLDDKSIGAKLIQTTVLYVDMRRSTELSLKHRQHTVAKLYSSFVRAMTRCATYFGGEVRGIIGDRVMVLFPAEKCFEKAIDTAELMNSVCKCVINPRFKHNEVSFGIGVDYGRMLATKTGVRRHGSAQQSYRSLVWLGRPANVASKLTDAANKPAETIALTTVNVAYSTAGGLEWREEYAQQFVQSFRYDAVSGMMRHFDPAFRLFRAQQTNMIARHATPAILLSESVYDGFIASRPTAPEIEDDWIREVSVEVAGYSGKVYGMDVIYGAFK